jgi:Tfp pilus assembly protein PilO
MLSRVSRHLAASGLTVLSLTPKGKASDGLLEWNRYELTLSGGYFRYLQFLDRLAAMPDPVKLGAISLQQSEIKPGSPGGAARQLRAIPLQQSEKQTLRITMELFI